MTVPLWIIFVVWTVVSFIPACLWRSSGDYDFSLIFPVAGGVISTLLGWLVYFIIT